MRAVALALVLLGFSAHATARRFSMVNDASTNSEGEVELEGWMDLGRPAPLRSNVMFWLGARFGLLDSLEIASFLVFEKRGGGAPVPPLDLGEGNGLMEWVTEVRWRPVEVGKWPVDLFVQAQIIDWFEPFHPIQLRFTLGASKHVGRFLLAANLSAWVSSEVQPPDLSRPRISWAWVEPSLAASVNLIEADGAIPMLNLGVEAWALLPILDTRLHSHLLMGGGVVVGPTLSASRGRLWLTAHLGVPVMSPRVTNVNAANDLANLSPGYDRPLVGRVTLGINL